MFIPLHDQNALKNVHLQFVTIILIALNFGFWLITATPQITGVLEANSIYVSYGFIPAVVNDFAVLPPELAVLPEQANYVTYAFLHTGFMHLAGNMLFLWVFGDNIEDAMGHLKFVVFYVICAIAGAVAHGISLPQSHAPLIGASGATAGIVSAYLMLHPRVKVWILALGRIPLRLSAMWVLGAWILFQIFNFLLDGTNEVSWAAHIGGALAGIALIPFFKRSDVALFDRNLLETGNVTSQSGQEKSDQQPGKMADRVNPVESPHKWGRGD
ncbi:MAG: rhomboid family intramembrane serine protease [Rhizobiaceae bacterium]